MSNLDQVAAFPVGTNADKALQRALLTTRMGYCLADSASLTTIDVIDPASAALPLAIIQLGRIFWLDALDSTTAHDGTTCLVSQDGKRYKVDTFDFPWSVLDKDLTTPPVTPSVGDAYIVGVASTGNWSGHDNAIAVYTAAGWQFITAPIGKFFYVEDETAFYHKNVSGTWTRGVGSLAFAASTVPDSALIGKPIRHIVVNQTTTAPPGSPTVGVRYIIGPSATGAWVGLDGKIAVCEDGSTFTVYTPRNGELAYDQAQNKEYRFNGSIWVVSTADSSALILISSQVASSSGVIDFTGLDDTYDRYQLEISSLKPTTDDVELLLRIGTGGTPTYQASAGYRWAGRYSSITGTGDASSASSTSIRVTLAAASSGFGIGNAAGENAQATIKFNNPEQADFCQFRSDFEYSTANGDTLCGMCSGRWNTAGAITAIRLLPSSGNFASGRFTLYGLKKS